jgi:hypothetical protein
MTLAAAGHALLHGLTTVHPAANSPILRSGFHLRSRIVASTAPSLSCSSFDFSSGTPAVFKAFAASVFLLSKEGTVSAADASDAGTTVDADGRRVAAGGVSGIGAALAKTTATPANPSPGYNELVVDGFEPAAVVVNIDGIVAAHVGQDDRLGGVRRIYDGSATPSPDAWRQIVASALVEFKQAAHEADLRNGHKLPIYGLVDGRLHRFEGFAPGAEPPFAVDGRGSVCLSDVPVDDAALKMARTLPDPDMLSRLDEFARLSAAPTSLADAMADAPALTAGDKADLALSTLDAFKPLYKNIPIEAARRHGADVAPVPLFEFVCTSEEEGQTLVMLRNPKGTMVPMKPEKLGALADRYPTLAACRDEAMAALAERDLAQAPSPRP